MTFLLFTLPAIVTMLAAGVALFLWAHVWAFAALFGAAGLIVLVAIAWEPLFGPSKAERETTARINAAARLHADYWQKRRAELERTYRLYRRP